MVLENWDKSSKVKHSRITIRFSVLEGNVLENVAQWLKLRIEPIRS